MIKEKIILIKRNEIFTIIIQRINKKESIIQPFQYF
jgi:hypothetical protein